jgi:hypothetical protein
MPETWRFLGRRFTVDAPERAVRVLRRLFAFPALEAALGSPWTVEVRSSDAGLPTLEDAFEAALHDCTVQVSPTPNGAWLARGSAGVLLGLHDERATLTLHGAGDSSDLQPCLMVAGIEALRSSGLVPLHAAIAVRDGAALALTGKSGAGKTTTLLHALRAGFAPLCEDFAWLEPTTMHVYGADRGLRCLPETARRLEAWFPQARPGAPDGDKALYDFADLGSRVWSAPLTRLWTLERGATPGLGPLSPSERLVALYTASGVPVTRAAQAQLTRLLPGIATRLELRRATLGAVDDTDWFARLADGALA